MRFQCPFCQAVNAIETADYGGEVGCGRCQKAVTAPANLSMPGVILGSDYVLREPLVKRSHETDFLAHQLSLERPVAVKVLNPELCRNKRFTDEFLKAARKCAAIFHPKACPVYAIGREEGVIYLVREAGDGVTLKQKLLSEGVMEWRQAVTVAADVAEALDYAWTTAQVMHFNLKPDYIMVSRSGSAKLADLGLAGIDPNENPDRIIGTPQYIAPERIVGLEGDNRADLYSLGITFFFTATGEFPFVADTTEQLITKHLQEFPRPANQIVPDIPPQICSIIDMLLEKNPNNRYQSGALLIEDLTAVLRGDKPKHCMKGGTITLLPDAPKVEQHAPIRPGTLKVRTESASSTRPGVLQASSAAERSTVIKLTRDGAIRVEEIEGASAPAPMVKPSLDAELTPRVAVPLSSAPEEEPEQPDVREPLRAITEDAPVPDTEAATEPEEAEPAAEEPPQEAGLLTVSRMMRTGAKHRVFKTHGRIPVNKLNLNKKK